MNNPFGFKIRETSATVIEGQGKCSNTSPAIMTSNEEVARGI